MAQRTAPLTAAEQAQLAEYHQQYLSAGLATAPADRPRAEAALARAYELAGCAPVPVIWADSPLTANLLILRDSLRASLWDSLQASLWASLWASLADSLQVGLWHSLADSFRVGLQASLVDNLLGSIRAGLWHSLKIIPTFTHFWGSMELYWIAYYQYIRHVLGVTYAPDAAEKLDILDDIGHACGWWYPFERVCIACERPDIIQMEEHPQRPGTYRLHATDGPAVRFRDGWSIYAWHGVRVPAKLIDAPSQITRDDILSEMNAEVRRAMMERLGHDRFASLLDLEPIHEEAWGGQTYTLLRSRERDMAAGDYLQFVRVTCPSTGRVYHLCVPPSVRTARGAVAWTFGMGADEYTPTIEA